ncbi:hypothetical protein BH23BAC2_BH23BAC2_23710 [soil metagenome]
MSQDGGRRYQQNNSSYNKKSRQLLPAGILNEQIIYYILSATIFNVNMTESVQSPSPIVYIVVYSPSPPKMGSLNLIIISSIVGSKEPTHCPSGTPGSHMAV